jgi:hypothetical protein
VHPNAAPARQQAPNEGFAATASAGGTAATAAGASASASAAAAADAASTEATVRGGEGRSFPLLAQSFELLRL